MSYDCGIQGYAQCSDDNCHRCHPWRFPEYQRRLELENFVKRIMEKIQKIENSIKKRKREKK